MRWIFILVFMSCVSLVIVACGGSSGSTTTSSAVQPGTTMTLAANSSVFVPTGTTITSPNGNTVIVSGSNNTVYTQAGATISVPSSATGPANNLVSTGQPTSGGISTLTANVKVIAGSATKNDAPVDGTGAAAILWGGGHLILDSLGNIIFSDRGILRKVTQAGVVTTVWGDLVSGNPVNFDAIAMDGAGNIYANGPDANFLSISPPQFVTGASINELTTSGTLKNIAADWVTYTNNSAGFGGMVIDNSGNLYVTDSLNNCIVKINSVGVVSAFAGSGITGASDGVGTSATFNFPSDLAIDTNGNLFVTDTGNSAIRKIKPDGTVSTYAKLQWLMVGAPIAIDPFGTIYVSGLPQSIQRIDPKGNITSFAVPGISDFITALVADGNGNLYADTRGVGAQILKISFDE
jgi:sugar lactone lactonase YvrE